MRLVRLLVLSLLALALLGSAIASGKPKPFTPKIGASTGTSKVAGTTSSTSGSPHRTTGTVSFSLHKK